MITRRHFLKTGGCAAASLLLPNGVLGQSTPAAASPPMTLTAQSVDSRFFGNDVITRTWGYNGMTPGPTIRAYRGGRVQVRFQNTIPQASSIHWHGIRIKNSMDGVPGLTQPFVKQGQFFDYDFTVPDAGTYWYHSHNKSWEQIARGLHGPLIVFEDNPPAVDRDIIVIVDDWLLDNRGQIAGGFDNIVQMAHDGRLGNSAKAFFRDTMTDQYPAPLKRNERVRFRFINPSTDRTFKLRIKGAKYRIVAFDGMAIKKPVSQRTLTLASAQRIDIIADITGNEFGVDFANLTQGLRLGTLPVQGEVAKNTAPIAAIEAHNLPAPNAQSGKKMDFIIGGGAMSTRAMGSMMRMMTGGNVSESIWAINGKSGMDATPYYRFKRGETGVLNMVNDTLFDHVMHLHGHHARVLGTPDTYQDSIFVARNQKVKVATLFDNPGKWMIHCHMLGHQVSGLMTWVEVV